LLCTFFGAPAQAADVPVKSFFPHARTFYNAGKDSHRRPRMAASFFRSRAQQWLLLADSVRSDAPNAPRRKERLLAGKPVFLDEVRRPFVMPNGTQVNGVVVRYAAVANLPDIAVKRSRVFETTFDATTGQMLATKFQLASDADAQRANIPRNIHRQVR
jgi:hypothetical protein